MGIKLQIDQDARKSTSNTRGLLLATESPQPRILYLIPTPKCPPGTSRHRWAVEHANLIRPMCPGGLTILGTHLPLRGTSPSPANDVDSAAAIAREITSPHRSSQPSLVLCRGPKGRAVVKQVPPNPDDPLKVADLKEVPQLTSNVISIRATLSIPRTLFPIISNLTTPTQLKSACSSVIDKLTSASILQLPDDLHTIVTTLDDNRSLAEIMGWKTSTAKAKKQSSLSHEPIDAQLLTPVGVECDQLDTAAENETEGGTTFSSLQGTLHLEAVAMLDATVGDVLNALQVDLARSLRTRVDLLVESYLPDADDGDDSQEQWDHPSFSLLPARVVASPVSADLRFFSLTEYLMPEEKVDDDLMSRFLEAFSWDEDKLEDFDVEQKEGHHPELAAYENISSSISPETDVASATDNSFDLQSVMQTSVLAAFVLGFLAIVIKQLLDFW